MASGRDDVFVAGWALIDVILEHCPDSDGVVSGDETAVKPSLSRG
jgi:hypothetical protein